MAGQNHLQYAVWLSSLGASLSRIQYIAYRVAQKVEPQHCEHDGDTRRIGHPRRRSKVSSGSNQHGPPFRSGRLGTKPDETPCVPEQLSRGAKDQLYVATRLAVADLMASEARLPVIFDDSFVSWDAPRRDNLRTLLDREADTGQILDLSHS